MIKVFLSASVPFLERDRRFYETVDVMLVREAVKALVVCLIEFNGRLVFGGHPAITPLIASLFDDFGFDPAQFVTLYQSSYFEEAFPAENERFGRVVRIPSVNGDRAQSLREMRQRMMSDAWLDKGVFIGGMDGVLEEFKMFADTYGLARAIPVGTTGAAAKMICEENPEIDRQFASEMSYLTLFRTHFQNLIEE